MSNDSPQLEDGYTRIANAILETIIRSGFTARELVIILFIFRKTYGYDKQMDVISLNQFSDATGISCSHVCHVLKKLEQTNVIHKSIATGGNASPARYGYNKHSGEWIPLPATAIIATGGNREPLPLAATTTERKRRYTGKRRKDSVRLPSTAIVPLPDMATLNEEVPPDLPEPREPTPLYALSLWFYESRGIPAKPTGADLRNFKMLMDFYPVDVIKKGIAWRLEHDPEGFWSTHISSASVYRNFGNWMSESTAKALKFDSWLDKNPSLDYRSLTDLMARADGFMRAFNEAKKNRLVYFGDENYTTYRKCIRIKTREAHDEVKGGT